MLKVICHRYDIMKTWKMNSAQPQKHNIYRNLILWQTHGVVNIIFTFKGVYCLCWVSSPEDRPSRTCKTDLASFACVSIWDIGTKLPREGGKSSGRKQGYSDGRQVCQGTKGKKVFQPWGTLPKIQKPRGHPLAYPIVHLQIGSKCVWVGSSSELSVMLILYTFNNVIFQGDVNRFCI